MSAVRLPEPAETMEVTCAEVAAWVDRPADERPRLIDCREPEEWDFCRIEGAELIPLNSFPQKAASLVASSPHGLIIYCHHGMRSLHATAFLRAHGLENAFSMAGGIDAWSRTTDPAVPRY
ncbi:MAG TPA: rhodanese-like domain-containing protein [Luteolibacter sp.]